MTEHEIVAKYVVAIRAAWNRHLAAEALARSLERSKKRGRAEETTKVEEPLVKKLRAAGHEVVRQVPCPGGRLDVYDATANECIECKANGGERALLDATRQLLDYQPHFPTAGLKIAIPRKLPSSQWFVNLLKRIGIVVIEVDSL